MPSASQLMPSLHQRFFQTLADAQPKFSLWGYSTLMQRAGRREFSDLMLKALVSTITHGMLSRHSLRAAELAGLLLSLCGGQEHVAQYLMQSLPLCNFGQRTQFYGMLVAYLTMLAVVGSGLHNCTATGTVGGRGGGSGGGGGGGGGSDEEFLLGGGGRGDGTANEEANAEQLDDLSMLEQDNNLLYV